MVNTVIVFMDRLLEARRLLDEYVVSVANHGSAPLVVDSVALTDFQGETTAPSDNPWLLEKLSLSRQDEINRRAKSALVQIGQGYAVVGVSSVIVGRRLQELLERRRRVGLRLQPAWPASPSCRFTSRHGLPEHQQSARY